MVQVRKLVLAIAAASALSSGMAHALGLGELTLKSTLNQPLVAEIELLDVKDLTAAEVVPSLASPEDFAKAGVDRQAFLNDLTFTPVLNASGKSVLRVTSSKPLSEPMVKFLVQVMWPNGRLLRDYSVLLDPSKFSPQTADAAAQPAPSQTVTAPVTGATHRNPIHHHAARYPVGNRREGAQRRLGPADHAGDPGAEPGCLYRRQHQPAENRPGAASAGSGTEHQPAATQGHC